MTDIKTTIRDKAHSFGFDDVRFAAAQADKSDAKALNRFLSKGLHGDMDWLARNAERRTDPQQLMPAARTIIVLGINYGPQHDPLSILDQSDRAAISIYAQGRDYHDIVKKKLKQLGRWLADAYGGDVKVFVDTAPVMERPLAARAGLGWQGKHTNLVSRTFGSWLFLGEVFTTLEIEPDKPEADHCGSCDACMRACPTDAIPEPNRLDPTRCISYLTIEHKSAIDPALMPAMGNRVYGCDDCLAVCPWNKYAVPTREHTFFPRAELQSPRLSDLAELDDAAFRTIFAGSPIKRAGRDRFVRNVMIAIGNSGNPALLPSVRRRISDESPLVREAAAWAAERLEGLKDAHMEPALDGSAP